MHKLAAGTHSSVFGRVRKQIIRQEVESPRLSALEYPHQEKRGLVCSHREVTSVIDLVVVRWPRSKKRFVIVIESYYDCIFIARKIPCICFCLPCDSLTDMYCTIKGLIRNDLDRHISYHTLSTIASKMMRISAPRFEYLPARRKRNVESVVTVLM